MRYVQIIKVIDELKPHITSCSDQTVCIDKDCATSVNIPLSGTDNCSDQIRFRTDIANRMAPMIRDQISQRSRDLTLQQEPYKIQIIGKIDVAMKIPATWRWRSKTARSRHHIVSNGIATVVMPSTGSVLNMGKRFWPGASDNCTKQANWSSALRRIQKMQVKYWPALIFRMAKSNRSM